MGIIGNVKEEIRLIRERDPAIHSSMEVFLYPSFRAMLHYRVAHKLYLSGHYFLARWISQRAVRKTGIEIHRFSEGRKRPSTTEAALSLEKPQRSAIM